MCDSMCNILSSKSCSFAKTCILFGLTRSKTMPLCNSIMHESNVASSHSEILHKKTNQCKHAMLKYKISKDTMVTWQNKIIQCNQIAAHNLKFEEVDN